MRWKWMSAGGQHVELDRHAAGISLTDLGVFGRLGRGFVEHGLRDDVTQVPLALLIDAVEMQDGITLIVLAGTEHGIPITMFPINTIIWGFIFGWYRNYHEGNSLCCGNGYKKCNDHDKEEWKDNKLFHEMDLHSEGFLEHDDKNTHCEQYKGLKPSAK